MTAAFALGQASFWMALCVCMSFAAVHLKELGFSNTELGLVLAAGNIGGALIGPILSSWVERTGRFTTAGMIRPMLALRALFLFALLFCTRRTLFCAFLYAAYIAVLQPVNALNLKFCVDAERRGLIIGF